MGGLIDVQRRFRELGRIRLGQKGEKEVTRNGKTKTVTFPKKLSEFRLTSASRELLDVAATVYGGEVREWEGAPTEGKQWELLTGTDRLDVLVPPGEPLTQSWELWSGGGCQRRCNGRAQTTGEPCACPADLDERLELSKKGEACKATSRLSLILPRVPDVGVWRIETHGLNAAVELPGTVDILRRALDAGTMVPAQLRIDQRTSVKDGETRHFIVPVLELPTITTAALFAGEVPTVALTPAPTQAIGPGEQPALPSAPPVANVGQPPPPDEPPLPHEEKVSEKWVRNLAIACTEMGLNRDARLALIAHAIGHQVETSKDVLVAEAKSVAEAVKKLKDGTHELVQVEADGPLVLAEKKPVPAGPVQYAPDEEPW